METTRCVLIYLVSACLWGTCCTSSIKLCTDSPTSFVNGTAIPAMLGKPVSVVLCVQCQPCLYISPYIQIKHPNHPTVPIYYFYTNNKDVWRPIIVNITPSANKATINITIKTAQKEDFTDQFSVTIHTNKFGDDYSVFFFHLSDTATSEFSRILRIRTRRTNRPLTPANGLTQAPTVLSTLATWIQVTPRCLPVQTSTCPQDWYQVDNDMCLIVMSFSHDTHPSYSRDLCSCHDGDQVLAANINNFTECLKYILRQSMPEPGNYDVRVDYNLYVDVQDAVTTYYSLYKQYNVACFQRKEYFKKPTVSLFALNMDDKTVRSSVDNITIYFTVNTAYAEVLLTCKADGVPTPRVVLTDESGNQMTSRTWIRLDVCSRAGVYTCTASNILGTSQAHRRIRILSQFKVSQFTASNNWRAEIRSGDTVELRCSVDGCPDKVTIFRNEHLIAETANYTIPLVHEITGVNCSHMGTYTCLAKSPTGEDVQESANLEVKGCPVSLCESKDASRQMSPILGENVTFSLCLMSSEGMKSSANETKIMAKFTRNHINRFYWTVNIVIYNIQVKDYRTHTVRIENIYGSLDVHFTLTDEADRDFLGGTMTVDSKRSSGTSNSACEQKSQGFVFESNTLLIGLPPIFFIIIVFIIAGTIWYRVKGTCTARSRAEETDASSSGNRDGRRGHYVNISPDMLPSAAFEEAAGMHYEGIVLNTDVSEDITHTEYVQINDVQYETPVNCIDRKKLTSHVHSSEYANTNTHF